MDISVVRFKDQPTTGGAPHLKMARGSAAHGDVHFGWLAASRLQISTSWGHARLANSTRRKLENPARWFCEVNLHLWRIDIDTHCEDSWVMDIHGTQHPQAAKYPRICPEKLPISWSFRIAECISASNYRKPQLWHLINLQTSGEVGLNWCIVVLKCLSIVRTQLILPSGKRLHNYGTSPCYQWVNPLCLWSFYSWFSH